MNKPCANLQGKLSHRPTWLVAFMLIIVIGVIALAPIATAGGHEEAGELQHTVTTDNKSGISLFLASLYNDHRLLYSLVVTVTMAILGMVVALVTEVGLKLLGVKKAGRAH